MEYIDKDFNNDLESNSLNYHQDTKAYPQNLTYPVVLYPYTLLEINKLQPPLPEKPQEPHKPIEPYKPSKKYKDDFPSECCLVIGLLALLLIVAGGLRYLDIGAFILLPLIAIICIPMGIYFIISKWKEQAKYKVEYPEKLAKYNREKEQYQKEKQEYDRKIQEYKKQYLKYEKDKEEVLLPHNVYQYRNRVMRERLSQNVKPSLSLTLTKKGVSETYFYSLLIEHFEGKIQHDMSYTHNEKTYFPDFVYYDSTTNLIVDIEIDEPYVGYSGSPIHYIKDRQDYYHEEITFSTIDDDRDNAINNGGWINFSPFLDSYYSKIS